MKHPKISEVLHCAADHFLATSIDYGEGVQDQIYDKVLNVAVARQSYSCWAIEEAAEFLFDPAKILQSDSVSVANEKQKEWDAFGIFTEQIFDGLTEMGLNPYSCTEFAEFAEGRGRSDLSPRQGARYLWLKFAALIAEEQGV